VRAAGSGRRGSSSRAPSTLCTVAIEVSDNPAVGTPQLVSSTGLLHRPPLSVHSTTTGSSSLRILRSATSFTGCHRLATESVGGVQDAWFEGEIPGQWGPIPSRLPVHGRRGAERPGYRVDRVLGRRRAAKPEMDRSPVPPGGVGSARRAWRPPDRALMARIDHRRVPVPWTFGSSARGYRVPVRGLTQP
jgi:hypothetical protein